MAADAEALVDIGRSVAADTTPAAWAKRVGERRSWRMQAHRHELAAVFVAETPTSVSGACRSGASAIPSATT